MTRLSRRQCCARLATLRCGFAAARCATVSPQEERQIGRKEAEELERTVGLVRERRIVGYVEAIGARLARAARTSRGSGAWPTSPTRAPSRPGGYVYGA